MKFKLFVISSESALERRSAVEDMLKSTEYDWEYIYASESEVSALSHNDDSILKYRGRKLLKGELGCYASHLKCWKTFINFVDYDYLIVMEDDVLLDVNCNFELLADLMNDCEIHYLRLYSRMIPKSILLGKINHRKLYRFTHEAYGTQCYMLDKLGAKKFIEMTKKGVRRPIDDEMDRYWENGVPNYAIYPYPAMELDFPSSIRDSYPKSEVKGYLRFLFKYNQKIDKLKRKITNSINKNQDNKLRKRLNTFKKNHKLVG